MPAPHNGNMSQYPLHVQPLSNIDFYFQNIYLRVFQAVSVNKCVVWPVSWRSVSVSVKSVSSILFQFGATTLSTFLARDVIYTSRAYAMTSVRLSVTEVHWCIIANLGFKFRSHFTGGRRAGLPCCARRAACGGSSRAMPASARLSCCRLFDPLYSLHSCPETMWHR